MVRTAYHYEVVAIDEGWLGRCTELDVEAIADSHDRAVFELRRAIATKLRENEAVAPPAPAAIDFDLVERPVRPRDAS